MARASIAVSGDFRASKEWNSGLPSLLVPFLTNGMESCCRPREANGVFPRAMLTMRNKKRDIVIDIIFTFIYLVVDLLAPYKKKYVY